MTGAHQHIIKKFSLELETADNGEQYKLQRRCGNMVKEKISPAMDEIFTAYFPGDTITRISKIEIDLGNIDADKLEEVFIQECVKQLKQKIKNFAIAQKSEAALVQSIPKAQNLLQQFFYFLETGILFLPATGHKVIEWEQNIIASVKEQKNFFANHFQQLVQTHPFAAERLAAQFDIDFINALLNATDTVYENGISDVYKKLQQKIQALQTGTNKKLLLAAVIQLLCEVQIKDWEQFLSSVAEQIDITATAGDAYPVTIEQWKNYLSAVSKIFLLPQQPDAAKKEYTKTMRANEEKQMPVKEEKPAATEVKSNGVFIDNAGLVILHPFLESLFETLGFTQNNSFINDACSYRAVHLLQYMATNEEATPEYIMPLNKLLCGIPAEEHIDRFIQLNENEKEEAQKLLQSVIGHWSILKQTSVEGLQQAFLRRRGKLSFNKTDAYWKLQVEKSAIDILLDKLPWGYSYIQLPWMQNRLITEWQS